MHPAELTISDLRTVFSHYVYLRLITFRERIALTLWFNQHMTKISGSKAGDQLTRLAARS
jgi:hypothetical protein